MKLRNRLEQHRRRIDRRLARLLPPNTQAPKSLHRALRYSVLSGGKRIRPILCLEAARVFGKLPTGILDLACAIEFLHTYSLIHDDLPALDNDDLRRGRLTCHKKFSESTAILAGDALLTLGFETAAGLKNLPAKKHIAILRELARAGGTRGGMIAGQVADLEAEGRRISPRQLEAIHRGKTGALMCASLRTGALYAGANKTALSRLSRFGEKLGLAFQIVDDILDVRSSTATLGKAAHKDAAHGKATYPGVHGLTKSEQMAAKLVDQACAQLKPLGARAEPLQAIARQLLARTK